MEESEENPPPPAEPVSTESPGDDASSEKPEAEPSAELPENQEVIGDTTQDTLDGEKPETESKQTDTQAASDAGPEQAEGEPALEPPAPAEAAGVIEPEPEKPEGEPASEQVAAEVGVIKPSSEMKVEVVPVHEIPAKHSQLSYAPGDTDLEFIGDLVKKMVTEVVGQDFGQDSGQDSELDFVSGIVKKIVAHAVGEESSESEVTLPCEKIEDIEQEGEEVTSEVLKYLLGPESLRYEMEPWKPEISPTCLSFMNVIDYARIFVDEILQKAKEVCFLKYGVPVKYHKKPFGVQNIRWPSIESFTVDVGAKKIDEYIQMTFEVEENWLYKINFIAAQSDLASDVYLYEAIFCIPTPCYPVAQATVSIYFNCEVSRVKPRECPIDVTYSIESLKEVLVPGKTVVNDDMLLRLVYSKLSVFKSLYF